MKRPVDEETTKKALRLIAIMSKKWLCIKVGITPHTLYVRLVDHNWKRSEALVIGSIFDSITKNKSAKEVEDGQEE